MLWIPQAEPVLLRQVCGRARLVLAARKGGSGFFIKALDNEMYRHDNHLFNDSICVGAVFCEGVGPTSNRLRMGRSKGYAPPDSDAG